MPCRPASSAIAFKSSREWNGAGSAPFWPSSRRTRRDDPVSAATAGRVRRLVHSMTGATTTAIGSAWRTASDFGTSSPATSER